MPNIKLDNIDLKILSILQRNCNLTTKELALLVNLSTTPMFERIKRLEKEGVIRRYVAILDMEKLNFGLVVFCNVKLKQVNYTTASEFTHAIAQMPQVTECYNVSGEADYMLKVYVADMKGYQDFILNQLGKIECVSDIKSTFVLDTNKDEVGFQLPTMP